MQLPQRLKRRKKKIILFYVTAAAVGERDAEGETVCETRALI